jgi:D-aspartate ligase
MAQRNGDPLALVMGDVDMVRALGIAGIPSAFFGVANESARFSSHVRVSLPWIDPWERQDQLVAALLDFARSQTEAPILFPQTDAALLLASRHRGRLAEGMRMMLADRDLIDQLVDKRRFQALAARRDLPVPPAQHLRPAPGRSAAGAGRPLPGGRQAAYADPGVGCSRRLWQGAPRGRP